MFELVKSEVSKEQKFINFVRESKAVKKYIYRFNIFFQNTEKIYQNNEKLCNLKINIKTLKDNILLINFFTTLGLYPKQLLTTIEKLIIELAAADDQKLTEDDQKLIAKMIRWQQKLEEKYKKIVLNKLDYETLLRVEQQKLWVEILSFYFDNNIKNGTLINSQYESWAKDFININEAKKQLIKVLDIELYNNIKHISNVIKTLFFEVFRDSSFIEKHNLKVINDYRSSLNNNLKTNDFSLESIIESKEVKIYNDFLIVEQEQAVVLSANENLINKYNLYEIKKNTEIIPELISNLEQIKSTMWKINFKKISEIKALIAVLKIIETNKSKFKEAIYSVWKLVLNKYYQETNSNNRLNIQQFKKWLNTFIEECKKQELLLKEISNNISSKNTSETKFEKLHNFINIINNFEIIVAGNNDFQQCENIEIVKFSSFSENIDEINASVLTNNKQISSNFLT